MDWLVSVPVMQRRSSNSQPQKHTNDVHDGVGQFALMFRGAEEISEKLDARVDQVTDEDTRRNDFSIWRLFLVQVPGSTDTQEVTAIPESIENQDDDVEHLQIGIRNQSSRTHSQKCVIRPTTPS